MAWWVVVGAVVLVVVASASPAGADGEAIAGRLLLDGGRPVAGVEVTVRAAGETVAVGRSGADGSFRLGVDGPGTYQVAISLDTLPGGVRLAEGAPGSLDRVVVQEGATKTVLFRLREGAPPAAPALGPRVATLLLAGLRTGLVVALAAVGLTLVYGTTGVVNLAQGELVTFGAVVAWLLADRGLPLLVAAPGAALAGALLGWGLDRAVWRPLRRRSVDVTTVMVISIGLALALRNGFLLVFGARSRAYADYAVQAPWLLGGVRVLPKTVAIVLLAAAALGLIAWALARTRKGTSVRAVGDDAELAAACGIDRDRTIATVWWGAGAVAALAGVLVGSIESVQWDMGARLLVLMAAAVVIGGLGSPLGALLGGVVVGVASELSTLWIRPDLKLAVALGVLIAVLLVRPEGLFGLGRRPG